VSLLLRHEESPSGINYVIDVTALQGRPLPPAYPRDTDRDYSVSRFLRAHLLSPSLLLLAPLTFPLGIGFSLSPSFPVVFLSFALLSLLSPSNLCTNMVKQEEGGGGEGSPHPRTCYAAV